MDESDYTDLIRLPKAELKKIINQCNDQIADTGSDQRESNRFQYIGIGLTVSHPGGHKRNFAFTP